jgi:hypothetical protein
MLAEVYEVYCLMSGGGYSGKRTATASDVCDSPTHDGHVHFAPRFFFLFLPNIALRTTLYIHQHPAFFFLRPVQGDPRTSSSPPPASPRHLATIAATTIAIRHHHHQPRARVVGWGRADWVPGRERGPTRLTSRLSSISSSRDCARGLSCIHPTSHYIRCTVTVALAHCGYSGLIVRVCRVFTVP